MTKDTQRIPVGKIATAHGVRGDVKIQYFLEDPDLLFTDGGVYTAPDGPKKLTLSYRNMLNGGALVAAVDGIADRNAAELLRGTTLYLDESDLPAPAEGEIYARALEGMEAMTPDGKVLGRVLGLRNFGASDLVEIQGPRGAFFLPFCAPYLVRVDEAARHIVLEEPEAL